MFQPTPNFSRSKPVVFAARLTAVYAALAIAASVSHAFAQESPTPAQEFYELRVYEIYDYEKQQIADNYLKTALLPALERQKIDRVGVFTNLKDENDHSLYVLIPFQSIDQFTNLDDKLASDEPYQQAAASYFDRDKKDPIFTRIRSRLLKAFAGMPTMMPNDDLGEDRIFELRVYESHTEDHARRKVKMFNEGETDIMKNAGLGPVFFGQTLIGNDAPNLVYMLSASNEDAHKEHWKAFLDDPAWKRINSLEEYKGTVSKITNTFLRPTEYSQF